LTRRLGTKRPPTFSSARGHDLHVRASGDRASCDLQEGSEEASPHVDVPVQSKVCQVESISVECRQMQRSTGCIGDCSTQNRSTKVLHTVLWAIMASPHDLP
jgi:hypothetical protein